MNRIKGWEGSSCLWPPCRPGCWRGRLQERCRGPRAGHSRRNRLFDGSRTFQAMILLNISIQSCHHPWNRCINRPKSTTSGRTTPWHFSHLGTSSLVSGLKISRFNHLRLAETVRSLFKKKSTLKQQTPEVVSLAALGAVGRLEAAVGLFRF